MTGRLPFNPDKTAAAAKAAQAASAPMTVAQLADQIGAALAVGFPKSVRVIGQISGFRDRTHWYFDLKDAAAVASCVMFASAAKKLRFQLRDGDEVVVTGRPDFYAKGGKVSFIVERIEPVGEGALERAFKALCAELKGLGWFDQDRKRDLPEWPRRLAVVTSRTGAALQDVLDTLRRRMPGLPVAVVDVRVQGDGAAGEVASAIRWLGREHVGLGVDVILVTRGGGSMEDLWAFNERTVAEAIVQSPIPVVAAIGHETDTTIAELVADLRCATPTQAAMRIAPDREAVAEQVQSLATRLRAAIARETDRTQELASLTRHLRLSMAGRAGSASHRLERLATRLEAVRPAAAQARRAALVQSLRDRLTGAMSRRLSAYDLPAMATGLDRARRVAMERASTRLASVERQLHAVGPQSVLRRGFSYTLLEDGRLLRSPADVAPGDRLRTRLADGEVRSLVEGKPPAPSRQPRRPNPPPDTPPQMDLFNKER